MRLLKYIFLVLVCSTLCFCDVDEDVVLEQDEYILSYLDTYDIEYDDLDALYRYVPNADDRDYEDESAIINTGDSFSFYFEAYTFTSTKGDLFYTNKDYLINDFVDDGLNAQEWSTEPVDAILGTTNLLKGVTKGLEGCYKGDSVVLIMTSDYAYEDESMGVVDPYSAIMFFATILKD